MKCGKYWIFERHSAIWTRRYLRGIQRLVSTHPSPSPKSLSSPWEVSIFGVGAFLTYQKWAFCVIFDNKIFWPNLATASQIVSHTLCVWRLMNIACLWQWFSCKNIESKLIRGPVILWRFAFTKSGTVWFPPVPGL